MEVGLSLLRWLARPSEPALAQASRRQPYADAVVHQHPHAIGPAVGKQVRVMRPCCPEHRNHPRQGGFCARAHVQRLHRQPQLIDANHRNSSRLQAASCAAAATGHTSDSVVAPRRSSTWIMGATSACARGDVHRQELRCVGCCNYRQRALRRRQLCTTLTLMPCFIATLATETPAAPHSARIRAFVSLL